MIDRKTLSVLFTVAVVLGTAAFVYAARHTIIAVIFAVFLAYLLEPLVVAAQRWLGGSRARGVAAVCLGFLVVFGIIAFTVGPRALSEGKRLNASLPSLLDKIGNGQIAWTFGIRHQWSEKTSEGVQRFLAGHRDQILQIIGAIKIRAAALLSNIIWVLLAPILAIFILLGKSSLSASVLSLIDVSRERRILRKVLLDLDSMLAQYIRAQLLLAVLAGAAYTVFLLIIRLPYAFALGPIAGMLEFIPLLGPLLGGVTTVAIALATGYRHWIAIVGFWIVWRGVQDYYNMPHFMRRELELHPLLAVTTVLAGGEIGGVLGMFLSIPAVGVIRVIWRNTVERRRPAPLRRRRDKGVDAAA